MSFLSGAPDIMMFNIKDAANPVYSHGFTAKQGACTDEFVPLTEGGFAITNMCNRTGMLPGIHAYSSQPVMLFVRWLAVSKQQVG